MRPNITPRFIRLRDAPQFFGMDKNRFNAEIRPFLREIRIGRQGRAFDRLEMEAFADDYKLTHSYRAPVDRSGMRLPSGARTTARALRRALPSVRDRKFSRALQRVGVRPTPPAPKLALVSPLRTVLERDANVPDDSPGNERPAAQWRKPWDNEESPAS
jgi:hypothetical protein